MSKKKFLKKYFVAAMVALSTIVMIASCDDSGSDGKKKVTSLLLLTSAARSLVYMNVTIADVSKSYADCTAADIGGGNWVVACGTSDGNEMVLLGIGNGSVGSHIAGGSITYMVSSPFYIGGSSTGAGIINANTVATHAGNTITGSFDGQVCDADANCKLISTGVYSVRY